MLVDVDSSVLQNGVGLRFLNHVRSGSSKTSSRFVSDIISSTAFPFMDAHRFGSTKSSPKFPPGNGISPVVSKNSVRPGELLRFDIQDGHGLDPLGAGVVPEDHCRKPPSNA